MFEGRSLRNLDIQVICVLNNSGYYPNLALYYWRHNSVNLGISKSDLGTQYFINAYTVADNSVWLFLGWLSSPYSSAR